MTDVAATWQQTCAALALATGFPGLVPGAGPTEAEDFAAAFLVLERAVHLADAPQQARIALLAGSLHALYGDAAVRELALALSEARALDPAAEHEPLFAALQAEWQARTLGEAAPAPAEALSTHPDPLVRFHTLCALALSQRPSKALDVRLTPSDLPPHLGWRLRSWQADCAEQLGQSERAAQLYGEAAAQTTGLNRAVLLQEQAALLLAQGDAAETRRLLTQARALYTGAPDEALSLSTWQYLQAQTLLTEGQPEQALAAIEAADQLEAAADGERSYGVALVWGQVLTHLGRHEEALGHLERALLLASGADRAYVQHELGVVLLDLDRPLEAREYLLAVQSSDYPYQAEVTADLAECDYRMGQLAGAQALAEQALALGAAVPASLVLGNVALEYYRLDEALEHFERVIAEAMPASRDWVTGHQMAADILAQQGFLQPAAVYAHAQQALEHTPPNDEWFATLEDHLQKAAALMNAGSGRVLN
ncbi:hypothetical protein ACFP81_07195 [Deinococcus lacus]|uniref:Tetratricopeptide repeat protein n=1 Tax=Deinococcus lacus TaxID=392561 RepID=A0ABW1YEF8_9DEIO